MKIYKSFDEIPYNKESIITVGTFDGVHKGHKVIIDELLLKAEKLNLRDLLITIHPHPQQVLNKSLREPISLLTTIDERLSLFEKYGVRNVFVLPFTYEFSLTSPEDFIVKYLMNKIGFSNLLIGYDHLFGKDRVGNIDLLNRLRTEHLFEIDRMDAFRESELVISSTKIRGFIKNGDIQTASGLLGYNYFYRGTVEVGDKRGRTLGYPTANVQSIEAGKLLPGNGVYLVKVHLDNEHFFGMANIGTRPTFKSEAKIMLEVNILDFNREIYGKNINVEFLSFIRDEKKFSSLDELVHQIQKDEIKCRNLI